MPEKRKNKRGKSNIDIVPQLGLIIGILIGTVPLIVIQDAVELVGTSLLVILFGLATTGWLLGWTIKFRYAPRKYTSKGISLSLTQFILSIIHITVFILGTMFIFVMIPIIFTAGSYFGIIFHDNPNAILMMFLIVIVIWQIIIVVGLQKSSYYASQWLGMTEKEYVDTMT